MNPLPPAPTHTPRIRWWPALLILATATIAILIVRNLHETPFQSRNLQTLGICLGALAALVAWWLIASRASRKLRIGVALGLAAALVLGAASFRVRGVTGDFVPVIEPRWTRAQPHLVPTPATAEPTTPPLAPPDTVFADFPQFLGPDRTGVLPEPALNPDWSQNPPTVLWRRPVGAAWSGFAIVASRALTQEQYDEEERVTCYETTTGRLLWSTADSARYATTIAGEGPRCTPTVVSNRVYSLGATGILNCLELETGQRLWQRHLPTDGEVPPRELPDWGYSGSPLVFNDRVVVSAGGTNHRSMIAYHLLTGKPIWMAGTRRISYSSPAFTTLAGVPQILAFNNRQITAHDPNAGRVLWEYPWGLGQPQVAVPVVTSSNRVLFSSGYGVGAELLELTPQPDHTLTVTSVWQSRRMKAKFANPVARDGFLYGLDDGMLACIDLKDGSQRWKEGRYGHGQGLLIQHHLLLMTEGGELVLLKPTPDAPNELHRFRVFNSKTWNPIALAGSLLLVRNDIEAVALRLTLADTGPL
jgi:outer membrane protein assembly factor BamB